MTNSDKPANTVTMINTVNGTDVHTVYMGLSKREHFAGVAMQGILANEQYEAPRKKNDYAMVKDAVAFADALLKELDK